MVCTVRNKCKLAVLLTAATSAAIMAFLLFKVTMLRTSQGGIVSQAEISERSFITACLDRLYTQKQYRFQAGSLRNLTAGLHFAFIGDSRIRQFFYSFLQILPELDFEKTTIPEGVLHVDRFVYSDLLNVFVTFQWRPTLLNVDLKNVSSVLEAWARYESIYLHSKTIPVPDVVVIGMSVHHMLHINGADYAQYEKGLKQIKPLLNKLAKKTRVVWPSQYPTNDWKWLHLSDIYTEKIARYNSILKNVLQDSAVEIWHDSHAVVSEYIRSCVLNGKQDKRSDAAFYFDCSDYIHLGGVVLKDLIMYLWKNICTKTWMHGS